MSLMLSNICYVNEVDSPSFEKPAQVNGRQMVTTVGLGRQSSLSAWLVLTQVRLLALVIA